MNSPDLIHRGYMPLMPHNLTHLLIPFNLSLSSSFGAYATIAQYAGAALAYLG